jgi:ribonuclease Z
MPVKPGSRIEISEKGRGKFVEAFSVEHTSKRRCLGYNVVDVRERLKACYSSLDGKAIAGIVKEKGREEVTERYEKKILSYGGDGLAVDPDYIRDTGLLIHEATFLDDGERGEDIHSTVSEAVATARRSNASELLLMHFSTRYASADIFRAVRTEVDKAELRIPVQILLGSRICPPAQVPATKESDAPGPQV